MFNSDEGWVNSVVSFLFVNVNMTLPLSVLVVLVHKGNVLLGDLRAFVGNGLDRLVIGGLGQEETDNFVVILFDGHV